MPDKKTVKEKVIARRSFPDYFGAATQSVKARRDPRAVGVIQADINSKRQSIFDQERAVAATTFAMAASGTYYYAAEALAQILNDQNKILKEQKNELNHLIQELEAAKSPSCSSPPGLSLPEPLSRPPPALATYGTSASQPPDRAMYNPSRSSRAGGQRQKKYTTRRLKKKTKTKKSRKPKKKPKRKTKANKRRKRIRTRRR